MWLTLVGSPLSGWGEQAVGGVVVLAVELRSKALGCASELGMDGDVFDALAVDPGLALGLTEPLEKLRTRSRTHAAPPRSCERPSRPCR